MKKILKYILIFAILIILFNVMLLFSSSFSSNLIEKNVKESAETLQEEGKFYLFKYAKIINNNATDSIMINTAYSIDNKEPIFSYMSARKNYNSDFTKIVLEDKTEELESYDSSDTNEYNPVLELSEFTDGKVDTSVTYARYWHGYLAILRVLLLFFNISEIRTLLLIVFIALLIYFMFLLNKNFDKKIAIIFGYSLLMYGYFYVSYSLESAPIFLVAIISSIILLKRIPKTKDFLMYIFIVGCVSNFVDFLTVPLITLVFPLIIYILYCNKTNKEIKKLYFLKVMLAWGIGYALTWLSKWVIYDCLYNKELIKSAIEQVVYRTVQNVSISGFLYEMAIFILTVFEYVILFAFGCGLAIEIIFGFDVKFKIVKNKKMNLPLLIISVLPFAWYIVLMNHTVNHWYFIYRHMVINLLSILLILNNSLDIKRISNKEDV